MKKLTYTLPYFLFSPLGSDLMKQTIFSTLLTFLFLDRRGNKDTYNYSSKYYFIYSSQT